MRDNSSEAIAANLAAPDAGLLPRTYVTIRPWEIEEDGGKGYQVQFGFWTGPLNVAVDVLDPDSGALESRDFVGDDALVGVSSIPLVTGLQIRRVTVTLSGIQAVVKSMLALHRLDRAPVQIHRVTLSPATRRPVSAPRCRFVGYVDEVTRPRPEANAAGPIGIVCISETAVYTRTNPAKRSHESHKARRGDDMLQYADVVADWDVRWGEESGSVTGTTGTGSGRGGRT